MTSDFPRHPANILEDTAGRLVNRDTNHAHDLNPTALAIWQVCDGQTETHEIARAVAELSGADLEGSLAQVKETIADLRRRGLIE